MQTIHFDRLLAYGFCQSGSTYTYREPFMDGQFEVVIEVGDEGQIKAFVWDCEMEEVYTAHCTKGPKGPFVSQVAATYERIFRQVEAACFPIQLFSSPQANRLVDYLKERWQEQPDSPFPTSPKTKCFRHPANQKWYALVAAIPRKQLVKDGGDDVIEIVNLKVPKEERADLLTREGIYPAYHMGTKPWVSILLDDTVADDFLFSLVATSRQLVAPFDTQQGHQPTYWVLPANPKVYAIDADFAASPLVYWPQKKGIVTGDWVAIYMTAPIQAIRYLCQVKETRVRAPGDGEDEVSMLLECRLIVADDRLPLAVLKEHGLTSIRSARRVPAACVSLIASLL